MTSIHDILALAGITVLDARVPPRPGSFTPEGIVIHHTANPSNGDLPSLPLLQHGRADLSGPLVQLGAGREGTIASVADGRANHAGKGSSAALTRVQRDQPPFSPGPDDTDGNTHFIGIEIENAGDGKHAYPESQIQHVIDTCVALCRHYSWSANRVIGHKEWTRRKPDPSFDMNYLRLEISKALVIPPDIHPMEEDMAIIYSTDPSHDQAEILDSAGTGLMVLGDGRDAEAFVKAGAKVIKLTTPLFDRIKKKADQ